MLKWLVQPVKVEKEKIEQLLTLLEKAEIPFDIVYPLDGEVLSPNKESYIFEKDIQYFVCGSYPLTRNVSKKTKNAVFSLEDYPFNKLWDIFGKSNFVNGDAKIAFSKDIDWFEEELFVRPLQDTKSFNGGIYNKNTLKFNGEVIYSSLKEISKEFRFFVINGKIITGSLYKINGVLNESSLIDNDAQEFAQEMVKKFNCPGYVIDVAKTGLGYKIMELNCLNASGLYASDLYKLILAVQEYYGY